jgi:uroporphyrinogen-III synthase
VDDASRSLRGKRVLITRAKEQSEDLFRRLRDLAAVPVCAPLIQFAPVEESGPLDAALRNLDRFDWLFLTSQNALRFVLERADVLGISLTTGASAIRVAAVAPITAAAAERAGLHVTYVATKHQGIGLAEELGAQLLGRRVFLPRSDKAGRQLPDALRKAGAEVEDVIAYRTLETPREANNLRDVVRRGEIDAIVFYSPSAVHHFSDLLGSGQTAMARDKMLFVAIGPVTAGALRESGVERILQAADTGTGAVLEALSRAFDSAAPGTSAGAKRG